MNFLPARIVLTAVCFAGAHQLNARTYSLDRLGCLFELAKPVLENRIILFSLAPLAERIALAPLYVTPEPGVPIPEETEPSHSEFAANFIHPPIQAPAGTESADGAENWAVFDAFRRWQSNPHVPGLSHSFTNPQSYMALDYSDIFETGRAPYKGGHGVSLFFRHEF